MIVKILFLFAALAFSHVKPDEYDDNTKFFVAMNTSIPLNTTLVQWNYQNSTLASMNCSVTGKFTFIVHGWLNDRNSANFKILKNKFVQYRGGCVIVLDWGFYTWHWNYFTVGFTYLPKVTAVFTRVLNKIVAEGVDPANILIFGDSFGSRMTIDAAIAFGPNRIGMIDACDPAGLGFAIADYNLNYKSAAKNVQTIHTSIFFGSVFRKAHQNFIMGNCGLAQPASMPMLLACQVAGTCNIMNTTLGYIDHTLCTAFYISSFENVFAAKNPNNCWGAVNVTTLPEGYKMGFDESRTPNVTGIIPVPTVAYPPYN